MHSLAAVVLPAPGKAPPSLAELAERPGLVATIVVKAGAGARLHQRPELAEAVLLRSAVLLLFEDPGEAARFEAAFRVSRAQSARAWAVRARRVSHRTAPNGST